MKPYGYKPKSGCDCINCIGKRQKTKKANRARVKLALRKEVCESQTQSKSSKSNGARPA